MIELQGVTRVFNVGDTQVRALDGLDLKFDPGDPPKAAPGAPRSASA